MTKRWLVLSVFATLVACGNDVSKKNGTVIVDPGTNNGTSGTNNGTSGTNNGTSGTNNQTNNQTNNGTSGTNNGTSGTNNGTSGTNNGTSGTNNGTNASWDDEYELRVTSLTFTDSTAMSLNSLVDAALDPAAENPMIVLMELDEVASADGAFMFRSSSGDTTAMANTYRWSPVPSASPGDFDDYSGEFDANIPIWSLSLEIDTGEVVNHVALDVRDATFTGVLLDETVTEAGGSVIGHLLKSDADQVELQLSPGSTPVTLTELLGEENLDYDSSTGTGVPSGSSSADAWLVSADFVAEETTIDD